ncbi:hypothetical protein BKA81DRAFT_192068 [Phyllosticta paracitricarpa]|uniref:Uncharacterized protein n=1 Tax=Phyllosticta paracitricarpa TaxID=2016321 RepID=A0ABR1NBZ4_9PEZI
MRLKARGVRLSDVANAHAAPACPPATLTRPGRLPTCALYRPTCQTTDTPLPPSTTPPSSAETQSLTVRRSGSRSQTRSSLVSVFCVPTIATRPSRQNLSSPLPTPVSSCPPASFSSRTAMLHRSDDDSRQGLSFGIQALQQSDGKGSRFCDFWRRRGDNIQDSESDVFPCRLFCAMLMDG